MNALEITNLTKHFPGFTLDKLSLTLPSGCIMGLIGENGAGKSTTIRLILDILHADGGEIRVLGRDSRECAKLTKEEVGVVPDEIGFPDCMTARQIARMLRATFANWDDAEFARLMKKLALPEDKPFKDFSRGMKMKLGIAAAMSHGSKLLLLDEPTSGLDPVARDEVVELFYDFTRDETHSVLISSHIVSDLERLCDYVAFLHKGKLLLCEEKDRLLDEYCIVRCALDELDAFNTASVKYKKETPYGAELILPREDVPHGFTSSKVSIEELFVVMAKEA